MCIKYEASGEKGIQVSLDGAAKTECAWRD